MPLSPPKIINLQANDCNASNQIVLDFNSFREIACLQCTTLMHVAVPLMFVCCCVTVNIYFCALLYLSLFTFIREMLNQTAVPSIRHQYAVLRYVQEVLATNLEGDQSKVVSFLMYT